MYFEWLSKSFDRPHPIDIKL